MDQYTEQLRPEKRNLSADLMAGLTFAVVNVPQSMAHALMATINPVQGIYTLILAMPVGALFTSSVFMNVSTTSALSVAVGSSLVGYTGDQKIQALASLVVMVGVFELILGLLKLGSMIRFVPNSVMTGFINGVAVLIILGQVSDMTGTNSAYSNKVAKALDVLLHPELIEWASVAISVLTIVIIVGLGRTRLRKIAPIFGLLISTLVVYVLQLSNVDLVKDVATITGALPHLVLPSLQLMVKMIIPAISLAIVGLIQGAGVSQSFPNPDGKFPDVSRDFVGQGAGNIAAGLFQGIPAGGSMSGTALNITSGAKTRWTNIFAGVFVALIIVFFSRLVGFIPMPALAALVLLAGVQSLHISDAITVYQTGPISIAAMALTFVGTLFIPLQYAVLAGVAFAILLYVFQASNQVKVIQIVPVADGLPEETPAPAQLPSDQVTVLLVYGSIFFAAAQTIENALPVVDDTHHAVVILGLRGHTEIASTFINTLSRYSAALQEKESKLMLAGIDKDVYELLRRTGVLAQIGEENVFLAEKQLGGSVNQALKAARSWLGQEPHLPTIQLKMD
jgi:SulP family sulfate permease